MNKATTTGAKTKSAAQAPADWRAQTLARVRTLIKQADPEAVEEVKWRKPSNAMRGVPVWSHAGIICTGETYKNVVKMTFAGPLSSRVEAGRPSGKRPDLKI